MRSPLDTLHNPIVLSLDPDAKYSPSSENTTLDIPQECPMRVFICSPLDTFHNMIVKSIDPDAKYSPFVENVTFETPPKCPVIVFRSLTSI